MTSLEFGKATRDLFSALNQAEPDNTLLKTWWKSLNEFELKTLESAYDAIIDLEAMPTLENVLIRCNVPKPAKEHVKSKDLPKPQAMNLALCGDGRDWARKILNAPNNREAIAIKNAKIALNIKT